jgi:hypothetical protein
VSDPSTYPWYSAVQGRVIEQGDVFEGCTVYSPTVVSAAGEPSELAFDWIDRDVIVLSQSCDLVEGREKVEAVTLCSVFQISDFNVGFLASSRGREDVRRGNMPAYHMLAESTIEGQACPIRIVDFRSIYALPVAYLRRLAEQRGPRLRLLPPYREHLAQSFARYFMRVGLPADIPPLK